MLSDLAQKKNYRSFSVSPEHLTGEKGKGGMAIEGSASHSARELGQGNRRDLSAASGRYFLGCLLVLG